MVVEFKPRSELVEQMLTEAEPIIEANENAEVQQIEEQGTGQEAQVETKEQEQPATQEQPKTQEPEQPSNTELITKFFRKEAAYRQKTETLKNENLFLKQKLDSLEKRFVELEKNSTDPNYIDDKYPNIYDRITEKRVGIQRDPVDEVRERLAKIENENKTLKEELTHKVTNFERQTFLNQYQSAIREESVKDDYAIARKLYTAKKTDMMAEAFDFAKAYAQKFQKVPGPQEVMKAVADYAKFEIDTMKEFLSSLESKKEDVKAGSGSQVKNEKSNENGVAVATLGGLASPRAAASIKSRQETLAEILDGEEI